jgi:hypothetical protein
MTIHNATKERGRGACDPNFEVRGYEVVTFRPTLQPGLRMAINEGAKGKFRTAWKKVRTKSRRVLICV